MGKEVAACSGQVFVPSSPDGLRERCAAGGRLELDAPAAIVSDGSRFAVLRASPLLKVMNGRVVEVSRDAKGRIVVVPREQDRGIGR